MKPLDNDRPFPHLPLHLPLHPAITEHTQRLKAKVKLNATIQMQDDFYPNLLCLILNKLAVTNHFVLYRPHSDVIIIVMHTILES